MPSDLSVPYAFCWDKIFKGIDDRGPYYKVSYYVADWTKSDTVANELRGYTSRVGTTTIRTSPHQLPISPNLCCVGVEIEGVGQPILNAAGIPSYDAGFFAHCEYRTIPWLPFGAADPGNNNQINPQAPVLWCSQELDFEDEVYLLDKNQYIWESDSTASKVPVKITVNVTTMSLTFHQLPYLPVGTLRSLRNGVNTVAFLGAAIGKVWFKGLKTMRNLNTDGTISQTVHMVFKERDIEWNKYLRPDGTWDYLKSPASVRVLPEYDLTPLLQI